MILLKSHKYKELCDKLKWMESEIAVMAADWNEYLEWKKQSEANREAAGSKGHFYIAADDVALLEKLIQEVNKDPDLAVLMTTPQGTTLTLRSHPQVNNNYHSSVSAEYNRGE